MSECVHIPKRVLFVTHSAIQKRSFCNMRWLDEPIHVKVRFPNKIMGGFRVFLLKGNVLDLAVGIIIGAAFTAIVNGMVQDIITPLIPLPAGSLADLAWMPPYGHTLVRWGAFVGAIINFLIVSSVVYFLVIEPMNLLLPPKTEPKEEVWD
jgi:large conductance mechanosensitive channel protein